MDQTGSGFAGEALERGSSVDVGAILLVPGILALVYLLPEAIKHEYVLRYTDPSIVTAYTSHWIHFTRSHLLSNVLAYLFVVLTAYGYAVASERRRQFVSFFVVAIVVLPFAISGLNIALVRPRVGYGFSPIVTGFLGFLPLALSAFLQSRTPFRFDPDHAPVFFFAGLGIVAVRSVPEPTKFAVVLLILGIIAGYLYGILTANSRSASRSTSWDGNRGVHLALVAVGLFVFGGMVLVAFPADPVQAGKITNLYSHLLGYSLGFIAPYVTYRFVE